jgi:hypothetical protein
LRRDTAVVNRLKWINRLFIAYAVGALAALVTAAVVGTNSKRPSGGQAMGDLYMIALSSVVVFVIAAAAALVVLTTMGRKN